MTEELAQMKWNKMLLSVFQQFAAVRALTFASSSQAGSQMNWHTTGTGTIDKHVSAQHIDFHETITLANGRVCHDKKRWCFSGSLLIFQRYRNEQYETIFEFQYENGQFVPCQPYWCVPDEYRAELCVSPQSIVFTMTIHSERKNELLRYEYV